MRIKFIEDGDDILAYFPETLRFFKVNPLTKSVIEMIDKGTLYKDIKVDGFTETDYDSIKRMLDECGETNSIERKGLGKFVLNITNMCNLGCRYCYANGGTYKSSEGIMSEEVAEKALNQAYEKFGSIHTIQIFGGEPTMNMPVIRFICKYITKRNESSEEKSQIGIVTNGTLFTDEFIQLVKDYHIGVTVSYDGNPEVNDIMRVYKNGTPTAAVILENMKKLRKSTGEPTLIEVTYNRHHTDLGVSIMDITKHIHKELGDVPIHIVPAGGDETCDFTLKNRKAFIQSIDDMFNEAGDFRHLNQYTYSLVERFLTALITKNYNKRICDAGTGTLSVSINGDVYPCFLFTDDNRLCMGNVMVENVFESEQFQKIFSRFEHFNKDENEECRRCFIRKSCNGCFGMSYLETGKVFQLSGITCEMARKMTERLILNLYRTQMKMQEENKDA